MLRIQRQTNSVRFAVAMCAVCCGVEQARSIFERPLDSGHDQNNGGCLRERRFECPIWNKRGQIAKGQNLSNNAQQNTAPPAINSNIEILPAELMVIDIYGHHGSASCSITFLRSSSESSSCSFSCRDLVVSNHVCTRPANKLPATSTTDHFSVGVGVPPAIKNAIPASIAKSKVKARGTHSAQTALEDSLCMNRNRRLRSESDFMPTSCHRTRNCDRRK
jgi:hypothetical protein